MEAANLPRPWSWLYRLAGRLKRPQAASSIGVIGSVDGPTSVYIARRPKDRFNTHFMFVRSPRNRRDNGTLSLELNPVEVLFAARTAALLIGAVVLVATTLYHLSGRKG